MPLPKERRGIVEKYPMIAGVNARFSICPITIMELDACQDLYVHVPGL